MFAPTWLWHKSDSCMTLSVASTKTVITVAITPGELSMNAAIRVSPCQRAAAALAAALTSACVQGTVVLVFDAANPVPGVPALVTRHGEWVARPARAPALATHERTMAQATPSRDGRRADAVEPHSRSTPRARAPQPLSTGARTAMLQAEAGPLPHTDQVMPLNLP